MKPFPRIAAADPSVFADVVRQWLVSGSAPAVFLPLTKDAISICKNGIFLDHWLGSVVVNGLFRTYKGGMMTRRGGPHVKGQRWRRRWGRILWSWGMKWTITKRWAYSLRVANIWLQRDGQIDKPDNQTYGPTPTARWTSMCSVGVTQEINGSLCWSKMEEGG